MTINGGQPHEVGDRGQRYEITYHDGEERLVFGWTDSAEQALRMEAAIHAHPSWGYPETRDRLMPNAS